MPDASRTAADRLASILNCLCLAVAGQANGGRISLALIALISRRIIGINLHIRRIVGRIAAGGVAPRRVAARRKPVLSRKRRPSALPIRYGWLLPLLPDAASFRSQLEYLFRDPEMAALLAAAPDALCRPLRSLCWMLRLAPPPILARRQPAAPDPVPPQPAATPAAPRSVAVRATPLPPPPARGKPGRRPPAPRFARGPPLPA